MNSTLKASVVIPTYNRGNRIIETLQNVLLQAGNDIEIIVVIDGSVDNTTEIITALALKYPQMRYVYQSNRGRSAAKNRGAMEAKSSLLIFYDDDMRPFPDSVQKHISFHETYDGILSGNSVEQISKLKTDIQNYKATLTHYWTSKYAEGVSKLDFGDLFFGAANCSMKKSQFQHLSGFDERLRDAEDYDLAVRAKLAGIDVYFDKSNRAEHDDVITCKSYIKRLRQYTAAQDVLKMLHPGRAEKIPSAVRKKKYFKKIFYRIFAHQFLVKLIDNGSFEAFLPVRIRYRFYSVVIQSLANEYPAVSL
jgi:glycosyltransferase involved in cell wall biosynthesis